MKSDILESTQSFSMSKKLQNNMLSEKHEILNLSMPQSSNLLSYPYLFPLHFSFSVHSQSHLVMN